MFVAMITLYYKKIFENLLIDWVQFNRDKVEFAVETTINGAVTLSSTWQILQKRFIIVCSERVNVT